MGGGSNTLEAQIILLPRLLEAEIQSATANLRMKPICKSMLVQRTVGNRLVAPARTRMVAGTEESALRQYFLTGLSVTSWMLRTHIAYARKRTVRLISMLRCPRKYALCGLED
ncbi:hypothetical protein Mapa_002552 [Marchantia paleacea]|nr:hypothetical protein Mapa_002552 [Marchantia paleacea]